MSVVAPAATATPDAPVLAQPKGPRRRTGQKPVGGVAASNVLWGYAAIALVP